MVMVNGTLYLDTGHESKADARCGVKSIELSMPNSSGGFTNADGSLLKKGERIWLENLDGYDDLRGVTITALSENEEIIWTASIPDEDENKGLTHLTNHDWKFFTHIYLQLHTSGRTILPTKESETRRLMVFRMNRLSK